MGANDRARDRKDDKGIAAGEKRKRRTNRGGADHVADWSGVDSETLARAIAAIAAVGGALRLGYTRDGGAYAIGIYGDGEPFTEYVSPGDDIDGYLKGIIEDYGK